MNAILGGSAEPSAVRHSLMLALHSVLWGANDIVTATDRLMRSVAAGVDTLAGQDLLPRRELTHIRPDLLKLYRLS